MKIKEKLKELLENTIPLLRTLFVKKIIPSAVKKGDELFDNFVDEKIKALAEQVDRYENALEADKKEKYKKGIIISSKMLQAVAEKLQTAAIEFQEAVK